MLEESRSLEKKVHLASEAQKAAKDVEQDYAEVNNLCGVIWLMTHQRGQGGVRSGLSSRKTFWLYNENVFSFSGYKTSGKRAGLV